MGAGRGEGEKVLKLSLIGGGEFVLTCTLYTLDLHHTMLKNVQGDANNYKVSINQSDLSHFVPRVSCIWYTSNANITDHSVGARDESHESEASQALMFCFDNASSEKSCFVVNLMRFVSPYLGIFVFLMPPNESEFFHSRESFFFSLTGLPVGLGEETKKTETRSSTSRRNCLI